MVSSYHSRLGVTDTRLHPCILSLIACFGLIFWGQSVNANPEPGLSDAARPVEDAAKFHLKPKANPALPTIHLVGDSTMRVGTPGQRGWGDEFAAFCDTGKFNVVNQAIGGRSSRTFQTEGRWQAVLDTVQKGDWVIIQFGHNDGGAINDKLRARGSLRGLGEEMQEIDNMLTGKREIVHTFGWYLRRYVSDVKARGATPILFSYVPRNHWKNDKFVRAGPNSHAAWTQALARELQVTFVDHHEIICRELESIGPEPTKAFFADTLHATTAGAKLNAKLAARGLRDLSGNPLAIPPIP